MTDRDPAGESRSAQPWRVPLERRHVVAAGVVVVLGTLLGLYREALFLSHFRINYLEYLGVGDIGLGFVDLLATVLDIRFLSTFAILVGALIVLLLIFYALRIGVAALRHATSLGRPFLPISDAVRETLAQRLPGGRSLAQHLRRYVLRPYRFGLILSVAALLAINVSTSAKQSDVHRLATALRSAPPGNDVTALRQSMRSNHRVVSVRTQEPPARLDNLVDLGSSQGFLFYYDAMARKPVVLPKRNVATVVADAGDQPEPVETARPDPSANGVERALASGIDGTTRSAKLQEQGATGGSGDVRAQANELKSRAAAEAGAASAAKLQTIADAAPAAGARAEGTKPPVGSSDGVASSDDRGESATTAAASAAGADQATGANPGAATTEEPAPARPDDSELAEIRSGFEQSRDSLDNLKEHMSALEGQVSEVNKFLGQLDLTLGKLDQMFADVANEAAAAGGLREHLTGVSADIELTSYQDCPEVELAQPVQFGVDQTGLDFAAIGVLFQARGQLAADRRSADRRAWLVVEGHDDTAGSTAHNLALSRQRAEAVRDFLRSELGIPNEVLKVVALGGTGPETRLVRLYDCFDRPQQVASAPPDVGSLGLTKVAAASEMREPPSTEADVEVEGAAANQTELAAADLSADLDAREDERALVLTVPGDLLWETNGDRVLRSADRELAEVARVLERYDTRRAVIIGHSDAYGQRDYNRWLSERRAEAVRAHLVERYGIDGDRLETRGMGEDRPIASNETTEGRRANRRVEIQILD